MSEYERFENKLVTCPYDEVHKVKASRLQLHIAKCKLNHLDKEMDTCPFNASHRFPRSEKDHHLMNCPDRGEVDRKLAKSVNENNPYKGRTDVPSYSEPIELPSEENWDEEMSVAGPGYEPKSAPPPGGIVEPRPMAKPAERRKLYQELHKMQNGPEKEQEPSQPPAKPSSVPRQPKQPSETQKLHSAKQQELNMQAAQNLGLGRGKSRIAANIFDPSKKANNLLYSEAMCNQVVNNFSQLGLGRGKNTSQTQVPLLDDDDFPTLGCGRGVRAPKQSPRAPGNKPK